ncbi:hypothetical protein GTY88_19565, partial [Streptomyces sp. SID5926]|nr:hypothetical protein [Streptomyces sp. SID5926]
MRGTRSQFSGSDLAEPGGKAEHAVMTVRTPQVWLPAQFADLTGLPP